MQCRWTYGALLEKRPGLVTRKISSNARRQEETGQCLTFLCQARGWGATSPWTKPPLQAAGRDPGGGAAAAGPGVVACAAVGEAHTSDGAFDSCHSKRRRCVACRLFSVCSSRCFVRQRCLGYEPSFHFVFLGKVCKIVSSKTFS